MNIEEQLKQLNQRLEALELKVFGHSKDSDLPGPSSTQSINPTFASAQRAEYRPPAQRMHARPMATSASTDTSATGSFLGIVGIICFVLAAAFLVNLAISSGWLTPIRQWGLLTTFGVGLIALGFLLETSDNEYAGRAAASGLVVLFFAAYSAHLIFDLFSPRMALGMAVAVSFVGLWLAKAFRSEVFSVTAVLGTYLSPLLLGFVQMPPEQLAGYYLIWTTVFALISTSLKSRATMILAAYAGIGIYAAMHVAEPQLSPLPMVVLVQTLQFLILLYGAIRYSLSLDEAMTQEQAMSYLPPLLFFYGTQYFFLSKWLGDLAPWISLGFALTILAAYFIARTKLRTKSDELASASVVGAFAAVVFFHAGYLELIPERLKPYLLLLFVFALLFNRGASSTKTWAAPIVALMLVSMIEFGKLIFNLVGGPTPAEIRLGFVTMISMLGVYLTGRSDFLKRAGSVYLVAAHVLAILSLYQMSEDHGSFAVSASWAVYSILVLVIAFQVRDWNFAKSSLVVFLLSAAKVLIYDVSAANGVVRIVCLLLTGALLYGAGFMFRQIAKRERR